MADRVGFVILACSVVVAGCGDARLPSGVVVRDSAGVKLVINHRPAWGASSAWTLAAVPTLEIGTLDGQSGYLFDGIAGVAQLSDGTIVVADGGSSELRFFDAQGELVSVAGGRGEGPGEFELMATLGRAAGDSIWVYDFALRRITLFTGNGALVRTTAIGPEIPTLGAVGRLADGSVVMAQLWAAARTAEARTLGLRRDPVVYARFDIRGALLDTLGLFPGRELYLTEEAGRLVMGPPPFGRTSSHAVAGGQVVIGDQATFELGWYDPHGRLQRLVRMPDVDLRIDAGALAEQVERQIAAVPVPQQPQLRAYWEQMERPATRPAYQYLLVDGAGNLWASVYAGPSGTPATWNVIDGGGRWLGAVAMPERFRPYQIGETWVLGVATDDLGIERVQRYALVRPS